MIMQNKTFNFFFLTIEKKKDIRKQSLAEAWKEMNQ